MPRRRALRVGYQSGVFSLACLSVMLDEDRDQDFRSSGRECMRIQVAMRDQMRTRAGCPAERGSRFPLDAKRRGED